MNFDFRPYFEKYEQLVAAADKAFHRVNSAFEECVKCKPSCSDCCFALFDLTLVEALYINHKFLETYKGSERVALLEKANRADRRIHRIKRKAFQSLQQGKEEGQVLAELSLERIRCPLLNERELCEMYAFRPITCRVYGIPFAIGGSGHTCGLSAFEPGNEYPTVNLSNIIGRLQEISAELLRDLKSRNIRLADLLVPLSMALITDYDDAYLGVGEPEKEEPPHSGRKSRKRKGS
ncbi:MAG: YkgJ family cysteine cluster protein [Desulfobacteraceae bacterium]|jgi:Fe-S-cluster containining protein|nr:YkgJ family cysteine cluster protein [Desulfobacteraceae bacterium]